MFWTSFILGLSVVQVFQPSPAAESSSALTCNVTHLPDGAVKYQLSEPPSSSNCETCWEDQNKIVIARDLIADPELTQNLTSQFITLKVCYDHLLYTRECSGDYEEVHCWVNCSALLHQDYLTHTVNSTLTCLFNSWCPDLWTFGLGIIGIVFLVVAFVLLYHWKVICKHRQQQSAHETASYSRASQQVKTDIGRQIDIDVV